ncbi:MAG: hypothetical protein WBN89_01660 [Prochlorococcaceae cyanobacterium]
MNQAEAFAAITVAAVASDRSFVDAEARLIREQLQSRAPFRSMSLPAFGELFPGLLLGLRETAFALAAQLIHCDREVTAGEGDFLEQLAGSLGLAPERSLQIIEVCALLNADCLA